MWCTPYPVAIRTRTYSYQLPLRSHRHDVIRRHTSFSPKDMLRHKLLRASKVMLGKLLQLSTQAVSRYSTPCIVKPLYHDTFPLLKLHVKKQRYKKLTCIPTRYVSRTHHQINGTTLLWAYTSLPIKIIPENPLIFRASTHTYSIARPEQKLFNVEIVSL